MTYDFFKCYDSLVQVPFFEDESVQLFRVAFFQSDFLQNPYFRWADSYLVGQLNNLRAYNLELSFQYTFFHQIGLWFVFLVHRMYYIYSIDPIYNLGMIGCYNPEFCFQNTLSHQIGLVAEYFCFAFLIHMWHYIHSMRPIDMDIL